MDVLRFSLCVDKWMMNLYTNMKQKQNDKQIKKNAAGTRKMYATTIATNKKSVGEWKKNKSNQIQTQEKHKNRNKKQTKGWRVVCCPSEHWNARRDDTKMVNNLPGHFQSSLPAHANEHFPSAIAPTDYPFVLLSTVDQLPPADVAKTIRKNYLLFILCIKSNKNSN